MIELQNIQGLTEEQIVDLLLDQKEQPFQVYIPKSTQFHFSEQQEVAANYAYLAYAGHLLKKVTDSFEYEEVAPEDQCRTGLPTLTKPDRSYSSSYMYNL